MGLEGAGQLQEASPVLQRGIWQELEVLRAPRISWGCCFHHLWEQRALRGAPKAEAAPGKALEREGLLFQAPSAPGRPGLGQLRGSSWQDAVLGTQE